MGRRVAAALGASLAASLAAGWPVSTAAAAAPGDTGVPSGGCSRPFDDSRVSCLFDATGATETWVVPTDVSFLLVHAWGAQGASLTRPDGRGFAGGRGSGVSVGVDVRPGETLTITVGTRGGTPEDGTGAAPAGVGGGGAGGGSGGGGGGATTLSDAAGRWIVVGGGGGASTQAPGADAAGAQADDARSCSVGVTVARAHAPSTRRGRMPTHGGAGGSGAAGGGGDGGGWTGGGAGRVGAACEPIAAGGAGGSTGIRADRAGFAVEVDPSGKVGDGRMSLEYHQYDVDGAPSVVLERVVDRRGSSQGAPVHLSAVFSEPVSGFTTTDVRIGGSAPGTHSRAVSDVAPYDGTHYDITLDSPAAAGTVTVSVPAGAATDGQFSASTASTTVSVGRPVEGAGPDRRPPPLRGP